MKQVSVSELKNRLSHFLRLVKQGEVIEVVERSVPVAFLKRVEVGTASKDSHLRRLLRDGIVSPPKKKATRGVVHKKALPSRTDPVRVLIEERSDR